MIAEGFGLLAAGMGMVFAFLTLLVVMLAVSGRIVRLLPASSREEKPERPAGPDDTESPKDKLAEIAAAIAAAKKRSRT